MDKKNRPSIERILTLIEVRSPGIVFSLILFVVVITALYTPEAWGTFGTGLVIADLVSTSLADTEFAAVGRLRVVALPLEDGNAGAATSRALAPLAPLAPTAIDLTRTINYWHALLILTPLPAESVRENYYFFQRVCEE
jgi:hypothetical protein